jgi:hypothetical protein
VNMKTQNTRFLTYRGATRFGLSLDGGNIYVNADRGSLVVDPKNDRRVSGEINLGVAEGDGFVEMKAVGSRPGESAFRLETTSEEFEPAVPGQPTIKVLYATLTVL